jgi:PAS domain S-box-containing protein
VNNDTVDELTITNHRLREELEKKTNELNQKLQELEYERQKNKNMAEKSVFEKAKDEAVLESIGHGVVTIDRKGNITFFNKAAELLTNWRADEVLGKPWFETVPELAGTSTLIAREGRAVFKALETGQRIVTTTVILQRGSKKIPVAMTATPIVYHGETIGAVGVFRDITHEQNVDRMKTEFISLASHQLRTPLSAIKWFCEMLLNGDAGELNPEQKEYAQNVADSSERMIGLVSSLLNISRIESGRIIINPKPTDINQLISEVITEVNVNTEIRKQKISVDIQSGLPLIKIDPQLIREVYVNLLTNASKYTSEGGEISVVIYSQEDQLISKVSDTGYGILKKDYDKVFQKFYRGENIIKIETEGNGLGLYLVKAIIESSRGRIWFESEEGKGPTFYFSLPISGMNAKEGEVTLDS